MPNKNENFYNLYKVLKGYPMLKLNLSSGTSLEFDISKRFYSENMGYCIFSSYKISKVQIQIQSGLTTLPEQMYNQYISLDMYGIFKIKTIETTSFSNYYIYIQTKNFISAFAGDNQYLIDLSVYIPEINFTPLLTQNFKLKKNLKPTL